ncbi:efflux ABC transporter, permease protein [Verrucomicrobiia bacterium DG1235]|nr:efflux ABC transporter, permease protein [Verrucomicrobiae bacterium DG1235]
MRFLAKWMRLVRGANASWEEDGMEEEMRFHLEMEAERNRAAGMSEAEARRKALAAFGNPNRVREDCRDELGWSWLGDFWRDVLHGFRVLGRRKGFAVSVVATLGLCLGANTAFFAALDRLVFEELPFADADDLVEVYRVDLSDGGAKLGSNLSLFNEYSSSADSFESVTYQQGKWSNVDIGGQVFRGNVLRVSDGFFETLGLAAAKGEPLRAESADGAAWLSHALWESSFGRDEGLLGQAIRVDGRDFRIAGIAPWEVDRVTEEVSLFVKLDRAEQAADAADEELRSASEGVVWARLAKGVTKAEALSELTGLERRFLESASAGYRNSNDTHLRRVEVGSVQEIRTQWARSRLTLLNVGTLLVLVIGCVNVANLLLAQANARGEEFWARAMLGARATRLVRQCVGETCLLVGFGWLASLWVSFLGIRFLEAYSSELFRQNAGIGFGWKAFGYSALVAVVVSIGLGLVVGWKALAASRRAESARSAVQATPSRAANWARSSLAIWQTAFTLALLIGGGLLIKSFYLVTSQDYGFDEEDLVTGRIHLTDAAYEDDALREGFKDRLLEVLGAHADVEGVALSTIIPTYGYPDRLVAKHDAVEGEARRRASFGYVSAGYLRTMGIGLLAGRDFADEDAFGWQTPLLVDERFAETHFPGENAIGKRVRLGGRPRNENNWPVIVGVVETARQASIEGELGLPMVYLPLKGSWVTEFSVFVKSRRESGVALRLIAEEVAKLDGRLPVYRSGSMEAVLAESLAGRRGLLWLCMGMGAVALALSAVGVYGASAFRVSQRLREFAIRLAIGATESRVIRTNVAADMRLAAWGLALGLLVAWQASRFLATWLYGVEAFDWQTYAILTSGVGVVYAVSNYLPSRRGVRAARL